jgi:hypothetical protein
LFVEVSHTNLTEVTRVVFVHVCSVVVLTTGKTTTTGMLAVLAHTTVTGGDVTPIQIDSARIFYDKHFAIYSTIQGGRGSKRSRRTSMVAPC